jgi:hypothetical protein
MSKHLGPLARSAVIVLRVNNGIFTLIFMSADEVVVLVSGFSTIIATEAIVGLERASKMTGCL